MVVVKAKSIDSTKTKDKKRLSPRELWAMVCFFYPQYTLESASILPMRDINLLLKVANKENAKKYVQLTKIATAPHTEKGKGVETLMQEYKEIIE